MTPCQSMHYVDLSILPQSKTKVTRRSFKGFFKLLLIILLLSGTAFSAYVFFWPVAETARSIFKAPQAVFSFFRPAEQNLKSTNGRTNFLLLGIDRRSYEQYKPDDCFRSDTMIVASVDPMSKNKDVVVISIPRDTWVQLPGWNSGNNRFPTQGAKINAANCYGDMYNYPQGRGLGLAKEVVEQTLDLHSLCG